MPRLPDLAARLAAEALDLLPLAAGLALAVVLPELLNCWGWSRADCARPSGLALLHLVGTTLSALVLLLIVATTRRWLPAAGAARQRGLLLQIAGLALLPSVFWLGANGLPLYQLQVQLTLAAATCLMLEYRARARRQRTEAERLRLDEAALERQLDAARAALLQAQVEPHFLFNTLAHLRRLAVTKPREARALLADLLRYLEAALPSLRQPVTTLDRELDLVRAFLALHQRRLGAQRLQLVFDIEPGWGELELPSTCLLTLAENAIKHGIAPQVAGGEIAVRVRREDRMLRLEVADTGAGMGAGAGSGTGLATLRAQLATHHRDARLSLILNQPRGLIARVELPV
jgi:sensor histidine kinase YesM